MLEVTFEVREDETEYVHAKHTVTFDNEKKYREWKIRQSGHPFLHIHIVHIASLA